jgi:hypothetical protein
MRKGKNQTPVATRAEGDSPEKTTKTKKHTVFTRSVCFVSMAKENMRHNTNKVKNPLTWPHYFPGWHLNNKVAVSCILRLLDS